MFTAMLCTKHLPYNGIVYPLVVLHDGTAITWVLLL